MDANFDFKDMYAHNDECIVFSDCVLKKDIGKLKKDTVLTEVLINLKKNKIKFNGGDCIHAMDLLIIPIDSTMTTVEEDSDFESEDD